MQKLALPHAAQTSANLDGNAFHADAESTGHAAEVSRSVIRGAEAVDLAIATETIPCTLFPRCRRSFDCMREHALGIERLRGLSNMGRSRVVRWVGLVSRLAEI